ncbi:hypothetical protein KP509_06G018900 [Ceratopteris richardii]|uniref:Uncharacterized protein n=1 Tax=Ceratopteris richardii TaxID=49495 RepID=A0A8T2UDY6_CERRI|nr:hypothetical protein KP509_06G018900 [Ceratopteris richardii]
MADSPRSDELRLGIQCDDCMIAAEERLYPIFRVPAVLRNIAPDKFSPQVLPIGPLHNPAWNPDMPDNLRSIYLEMDKYKLISWHKIFKEDMPDQEIPFLRFLHQHREAMLAAYGGYFQNQHQAHMEKFVNLVALDSCLLAALLHWLFQEDFPYLKRKMSIDEVIMANKVSTTGHLFPIYSRKLPRPLQKAMLEDILLLENQVPLLAVKQAIKIESKCGSDEEAEEVLRLFVAALAHRVLPFTRPTQNVLDRVKRVPTGAHHLMDMMYSIVCMNMDPHDSTSENLGLNSLPFDHTVRGTPSSNRIYLSGIKLHGNWGSLNEISFDEGKLVLPKIHVGDDTERYFRNLIAYESCFKTERLDVISYLHFMDFLIDTPEDVNILVESKVITEAIGSNEKVAEMWNSLCRNTMCVFSPKYKDVSERVQQYCKSPGRKMWAEFYRSKLSRPWLVASLLSAAALLILNVLIVWYTMLTYKNDKKQS